MRTMRPTSLRQPATARVAVAVESGHAAPAGQCAALRWLSAVAAVTLLLVLLPPATVVDAAEPRGLDRVCPVPDGLSTDVADPLDRGEAHGEAILCAVGYGLVSGFGDGTYRPGQAVTRGQTASVVAAWLEVATGFALEVPEEELFTDQGLTHGEAISKLAAIEVIAGRGDGTFRPEDPLTRGQFARVIVNAISYADVFSTSGPLPPPPDATADGFDDVAGIAFEDDILALAGTGITTGIDDHRFAPGEQITRGQLATFLMRSADYLDRHQRWKPTAVIAILVADLQLVPAASTARDGGGEVTAAGGEVTAAGGEVTAAGDEITGGGDEVIEGTDGDSDGLEEGAGSADADPAPGDGEGAGGATPPSAKASVIINAFNGTAGYLVELSDVDGDLSEDARLTLRLGTLDAEGPVVLTLAEAAELTAALASDGIATGVATEADSAVRFAELVVREDGVVIELQGSSQGPLRGLLRREE